MNHRIGMIVVTMAVLVGASVSAVPAWSARAASAGVVPDSVLPPPGAWARQPLAPGSAPTERDGVLGYDSTNGHFLYFNGIFAGAPSNDLWSFDPTTDAWQLVVAHGTPPSVATAQRNVTWDPVDRRFLVVNSFGPETDVVTYDADSNTWSTVQTVGGPIAVSAAGVVWDTFAHRLLVFGGCYGSDICSSSRSLWSYDPASRSWALLPPKGVVPSNASGEMTVWDASDNKMLLVGGADTWSWDSLTNVWTRLVAANAGGGPPPTARGWASAVWDPIDREVLLFGGARFATGVGWIPLDELWAFHPDTHSWTALPPNGSHPPANAFDAFTLTDAATWDPTTSSMRLLTLDPQSTTPVTALWSYRPLPPVPGGLSFGMQVGTSGATLSWQTGDSQSGYRVIRRDGTSTTVVGGTLPANATSFTDPTPPTSLLCYQLATMGGPAIVALSGMLCAMASGPATARDPRDPGISFDTGDRVTLRWDAPAASVPVFGGYVVSRADQVLAVLIGSATSYTSDPVNGHSCWYVRAHDGAGWTGRTSTMCAVPELSSR